MGLLEKALQYYSLVAEKKTARFLAHAAMYSASRESAEPLELQEVGVTGIPSRAGRSVLDPHGLLAKAERFYIEGTREGLFTQAQRFGAAHVPRGMKVGKVGLLCKALQLREELELVPDESLLTEEEVLPEVEIIPKEKAPVEETFPAEEEAPIEEEEPVEVPSRERIEEPVREEVPAGVSTAGEEPSAGKRAAAETAPAEVAEPWIPIPILESLLEQNDSMGILDRFTGLVSGEGFDTFCTAMLQALIYLARGKSGILVTLQRRGYREESLLVPDAMREDPKGGRRKKISYGKTSKLIRHLQENPDEAVTSRSLKDEKVLEESTALELYEPWTIVPIAVGEHLYGFFLIGNHPKRPAVSEERLLYLTKLSAFHIAPWVVERNSGEQIDALNDKKDELSSLLQLYDFSVLTSFSIQEILNHIAEQFEIGAAVVATGWDDKGSPQVRAAVGLSERGVKRYRVSKSDRTIKAVIREGEPDIPEDLEKRLNGFLKEDREAVNTAVIVPIQFCGTTLGVMIVHRMKGVTTRITGRDRAALQQIGRSLVPYVIYDRMINLEPYEVFEELLEREAARARKQRSSLHVVAFRVKNYKAIIKEKSFDHYRKLLERFSDLIRGKVGEQGVVHTVSLNKVVFLLVMKDADEATHLVVEAKSAVGELLQKEKAKLPLSLQPFRTTYPNESKSVAEILQLIE